MTNSAKLYLVANTLRGLKEWERGNNPIIIQWIREWFREAQDDGLTAWCGIGTAMFCKMADLDHIIPDQPYGARNWLTVGRSVTLQQARRGDIVVLWRQSPESWKGHVCLFEEYNPEINPNIVKCLGANQKDTIRTNGYGTYRILDIRRP